MDSPSSSPSPVRALTPELALSLKERTQSTLASIVTRNSITKFFNEAPALSSLRSSLGQDALNDQDRLRDLFYQTVPLSSYSAYEPFISRFFTTPCNASDVSDLLAPGFPEYFGYTSGTSGERVKHFPKYMHGRPQFPHLPKRETLTTCNISTLQYSHIVEIMTEAEGQENSSLFKKVPICQATSMGIRRQLGIDIDGDEALMGQRAPSNHTSPYAVSFIQTSPLCYLMHGLFAILDPSLRVINITFSTLFHDMIRLLEEHWDTLVQAVDDGQLPSFPDLGDLGNLEPHLQGALKADPVRAVELRAIEKSTEGWLKKVWPRLSRVHTIASGQYGFIVPKLRYHLGTSVIIDSCITAATEATIGYGYDVSDLNLFKTVGLDYFEYLPLDKPQTSEELLQSWELEVGKKYEVVVTTRDGLWRYQLGDAFEVAGFSPVDGQPVVRFYTRRNVGIRITGEWVTENELRDAIHSVKDTLGTVLEFSVAEDDRKFPRTHGFFVELDGEPGPNASAAIPHIQAFLSERNNMYAVSIEKMKLGAPTIRLVKPGTFRAYRDWRVRRSGIGTGLQIKVPVVIGDRATVEWLEQRVVDEVLVGV